MSKADYRKRLILTWILGVMGLSILVGSVNWFKLFRIYRNPAGVLVTVRQLEPDNRNAIHYTYVVSAISYEGEGHDGNGNPPFDRIKAGDRLRGYYDVNEPSISVLGEVGVQLARETVFVLCVALLLPSLVVLRAAKRYDRWLQDVEAGKVS